MHPRLLLHALAWARAITRQAVRLPYNRTCAHGLVTLATLMLLTACGGGEKFYRLTADGPAPTRTSGLAVGIGPVNLPGYVDRAELVFQSGPNEFAVPPSAHWSGTLGENILNALRDDVGRRLGSGNVLTYPWPSGSPVRYQVAIDVRQFHAMSGGSSTLECSWRVVEPSSGQTLSRHNGSYQEPIAGDGYDPVVASESKLLAQLADDIVRSLPGRSR